MTSKQLRQFRKEKKWSQDKMAKRIGVSRISIRKYEHLPPDDDVPLVIALACGSIAWGLPPFGERGVIAE